MRNAWDHARIADVCEIVNGGTPKTSVPEYWNGKYAWITPAEMGKRPTPYANDTTRKLSDSGLQDSSATLLPPDSVILSSRAPIGHLVINQVPMATNQGCKGLVPGTRLEHKFLYYFLLANIELLQSLGTGTTFKELSAGKLKEVVIPVPPLGEQRRIVAILDKAFAAIATAKANTEKNLQNAHATFHSELERIFATEWAANPIVKLSEIASDITDGDHLPPPKSLTGVPFITIGNIVKETRTIDFSDTFKVPRAYFGSLKANRKPRKGDVLYTVTGSFGIPVLVQNGTEFCFQRHIGLVRPKPETDSRWLYYLLLSPQIFRQAQECATGAAQRTVSLKSLRTFDVPRIPIARQREIGGNLDSLSARVGGLDHNCKRKLIALNELKKSLLHEAFNGRL